MVEERGINFKIFQILKVFSSFRSVHRFRFHFLLELIEPLSPNYQPQNSKRTLTNAFTGEQLSIKHVECHDGSFISLKIRCFSSANKRLRQQTGQNIGKFRMKRKA